MYYCQVILAYFLHFIYFVHVVFCLIFTYNYLVHRWPSQELEAQVVYIE